MRAAQFRVVPPKGTRVNWVDCGNAACETVTLGMWCGFSGPTPRRISYIGLYPYEGIAQLEERLVYAQEAERISQVRALLPSPRL